MSMRGFTQLARNAFAALGLGLLVLAIPYAMLTEAPMPVPVVMALGVVALAVWYAMARQAR